MKKLLKKFFEMFPLRAARAIDDRKVVVRNKIKIFFAALLTLVTCSILNSIGRPSREKLTTVVTDSTITVDGSRSFSQLIAASHFDILGMDIVLNEHVMGVGKQEIKTRLFPLKAGITGPQHLTMDLEDKGYRPATEDELLTWGAKNPLEQLKYAILTSPESKRARNVDCRYLSIALYGTKNTRGLKAVCQHFPYLSQETFVLAVKK